MAYIPYGYRIVNGRAVIDEEMQKQVITLYECFAAGTTYKQSQETSGVKRTPKACRYLLQDATYLGDDFYPPLLERELFNLARAERIRRGPGRGGRKRRGDMPVLMHFRLDDDLRTGKEYQTVGNLCRDKGIDPDNLPLSDHSKDEASRGSSSSLGDRPPSSDPFANAARFYERIVPVKGAAAMHTTIPANTGGSRQ